MSSLELTKTQEADFVDLVGEGASREEVAKVLKLDPREISKILAEIVFENRGGEVREAVLKRVANSYVAERAFSPKVTKERRISKLYRVSPQEKAALEKGGQIGEEILEALECGGMCVKLEQTTVTLPHDEKLILRLLDGDLRSKGKEKETFMDFPPLSEDLPDV